MRVRAAQRDAPEHVVHPQVAGVGELAGDLEGAVRRAPGCRRCRRPAGGRWSVAPRRAASGWSSGRSSRCRSWSSPGRGEHGAVRRDTASRARSRSSTVTTRSASTTVRPSTSSSSSGGRRAEHQRGHRVGDAGVREPVEPPQRDVGELAGLQRADLVVPAEAPRAPPIVASSSAVADRSAPAGRRRRGRTAARGAAPRPARPPRCDAAPSTPSPTGTPAVAQVPGRGRCRRRAGRWRTGSARRRCRSRPDRDDRRVVEVDGVREPDVGAEPAERSMYSTGVQPNRSRQYSSSSRVSARWVCSRTPASPGQRGRLAHQVGGHRERRAGRHRDPQHRVRRRVVVAVDRRPRWRPGSRRGPRPRRRAAARPGAGPGPSSRGSGGTAGPRSRAASTSAANRSPPPRGKT